MATILTILGIGLILFVHEAGHFFAARRAGVRVEVFSLGFGPRLFGWRGAETDYRISLLPLGGYVRMSGEEQNRPPRKGELGAASAGQRFLIFSGGILMNFLFALILIPILFRLGVPFEAPVVGVVEQGSPAWKAGIQEGDQLLHVGEDPMHGFRNFFAAVALSEESEIQIEIAPRVGETESRWFTIEPEFNEDSGFKRVGVGPAIMDPKLIMEVLPDSLASKAGLQSGDQLTGVNGVSVSSPQEARLLLQDTSLYRKPLSLNWWRDNPNAPEIGTTTLPLPEASEEGPLQVGVRQAAVVVEENHLFPTLPFQKGDVLLEANGQPIQRLDDLATLCIQNRGFPETTFLRDGVSNKTKGVAEVSAADLLANLWLTEGDSFRVAVIPNGAAAKAGLQDHDILLRLNGEPLSDINQLSRRVQQDLEEPLEFLVARNNAPNPITIRVQPAPGPNLSYGFGFRSWRVTVKSSSLLQALHMGLTEAQRMVIEIKNTLAGMFSGKVAKKNMGGIILIGQVTHSFASEGFIPLLFFLAMISIHLGVLNLLPIPALDGGHMLLVILEKIRGKPLSSRTQGAFNMVGALLILGLVFFVTMQDISRIMG